MSAFVYGFTILVALACAMLLLRGYVQSRLRLLFWSALCFFGLAAANVLLFMDLVILPQYDVYTLRLALTALSLGLLVAGFIWDSE